MYVRGGHHGHVIQMLRTLPMETPHFFLQNCLIERFPLPLGAWDGLRYFIVALPEPSI